MPDTDTALTAEQVTVALDWLDREVLLVPDEIARRMERERKDGWQEAYGFAWGQSRPFPAGTWMHQSITTLIAAYVASPVPDTLAGRDRVQAESDRHFAQQYSDLRPNIVGVGDWNPDTRHWLDYPNHSDLHVGGSASKTCDRKAFHFSG